MKILAVINPNSVDLFKEEVKAMNLVARIEGRVLYLSEFLDAWGLEIGGEKISYAFVDSIQKGN